MGGKRERRDGGHIQTRKAREGRPALDQSAKLRPTDLGLALPDCRDTLVLQARYLIGALASTPLHQAPVLQCHHSTDWGCRALYPMTFQPGSGICALSRLPGTITLSLFHTRAFIVASPVASPRIARTMSGSGTRICCITKLDRLSADECQIKRTRSQTHRRRRMNTRRGGDCHWVPTGRLASPLILRFDSLLRPCSRSQGGGGPENGCECPTLCSFE